MISDIIQSVMALQPGVALGDWRLLEPLGAGGFGEVWKARHAERDEFVAIKIAREAAAIQLFQSGAILQRGLDHPNIVKVLDLWARHDPPFIVMELVDGCTLAERIRECREQNRFLPVDEALALFAQILDATAYAHGRRPAVIHGDLKPHNILVDRNGRARIIDFDFGHRQGPSIASIELSGDRRDSVLRGTWAYMAPEQKSGAVPDERSEIYTLGIILQEMLTNLADIGRSRPSSVNPAIQPPVEQALLRALEGVRGQRFASVREFAEALGKPRPPEPFWFASPFHWVDPVDLPGDMAVAAFSSEGALAVGGEQGGVRVWPGLRPFHGAPGYVTALVFSGDGDRLAAGTLSGAVTVWDVATASTIAKIYAAKCAVSTLAFSPDGRLLATGSDDGAVRVWEVATGRAADELRRHERGVSALSWNVSAGWDGSVWIGARRMQFASPATAIAEDRIFGCDDGTVIVDGHEVAHHERRVRAVGRGWSADDDDVRIWGGRTIPAPGFRAAQPPRIACATSRGGIRISAGLPDRIDWSAGSGGRAVAEVRAESRPGIVEIRVGVTAIEPVHRLLGRVRCDSPVLDGAVIPFGKVEKGALSGVRIGVPPAAKAQKLVASIEFGPTTPPQTFEVEIVPEAPRDVRYALRVRDDTPNARGNRDRKIQPGESVDVELSLKNAGAAIVRLRVDAACDTAGARLLRVPAREIAIAPGATMPVARTLVVSKDFAGETVAVRWMVGDSVLRFAIPLNRTIAVVEGVLQASKGS